MGRVGSSFVASSVLCEHKDKAGRGSERGEADFPWPLGSRWLGRSAGRTCAVWLRQLLGLLLLTAHSRYGPRLGPSEHIVTLVPNSATQSDSQTWKIPICPCKAHLVVFNYWQQQGHVVGCEFLSFYLLIRFKKKFMIYGLYESGLPWGTIFLHELNMFQVILIHE